jgi:DNA-binding transcriptional regulator YhcF (GntR family)
MLLMALASLKRLFRIQSVGDLKLNYVQILLYLESHEKGERLSSPEKLARELGIAELTVVRAYESLLQHKFIAAGPNVFFSPESDIRDPSEFEVTPLAGRL